MTGEPWKDPERLREMYVEKGLPMPEVADRLGTTPGTVHYWATEKFGLVRKWKDPELLEELYWGEGLTTVEIADRFGCSHATVSSKLHEYGIDVRSNGSLPWASYTVDKRGYPVWRATVDDGRRPVEYPVHRLLAVAEYGPDPVKDRVTHHKNGHKIDNRPENIELMTRSEHASEHYSEEMLPMGLNP